MQTYQVGFDRVSAVRKAKNKYFLLSLFYFDIEWGVQSDVKREIQGFRGTRVGLHQGLLTVQGPM